MRKTIITATLALFGIASAATVTPSRVYYNGSETDVKAVDKPYTLDLGSYTLNSSDGFSIAFNVKFANSSAVDWKDAFTFTLTDDDTDGDTYKIELNNGNDIYIYGKVDASGNNLADSNQLGLHNTVITKSDITKGEWMHVGLSFSGNTMTAYIDGAETTTKTLSTGTYSIQSMGFNGGNVPSNNGDILLDNVAVYKGVLGADDFRQLAIPEPATATLSLLALAGLAARRRRK